MKRNRALKRSADCQSAVSQIDNLRRVKCSDIADNQSVQIMQFISGIRGAIAEDREEGLSAEELLQKIPKWAGNIDRRTQT